MDATKRELLQRAVRLYGAGALAAKLGVSEMTLEAWMRGDATMPDGEFLVLACLLQKLASRPG
jgi:transcriptional regulator with XRE-family HTH domain